MVVRRTVAIVAVLIIFLLPAYTTTHAATDKQRIFDDATILSAKESASLEKFAKKYSDKRQVDFIVITMHGDENIKKYMGDFYDNHNLGYNKKRGDVALIALNMKSRDVQLAGFGEVEFTLPDERFDLIREKITPALSSGDYVHAFEEFITLSSRYMTFKSGANPANPLYSTSVQFGIAFVFSVMVVFMMAANHRSKITVTAENYFDRASSKENRREDTYLRTTVTKTYSPREKSSGGGGGGGGRSSGGGRTGGGSSFSGSSGKF